MNPAFNINNTNGTDAPAHLVIHAGRQGLAIGCFNKGNDLLHWLKIFHFEKGKSDEILAADISDIFKSLPIEQDFEKVDIVWTFDQYLLIPQKYYSTDTNADLLELVHGNLLDGTTQNDYVYKQNLHVVYKVPASIKKVITSFFPQSNQRHLASLLVETEKTDLFYVIFYPGSMVVLLKKENRLFALQQFNYNTPDDAAYYLLSTCINNKVNPADTVLIAAGMLDADSSLFLELHKYFKGISFDTFPGSFKEEDSVKNYPSHYFSNLVASAACV